MKIYVVEKKDYFKYKQKDLEKIAQEVEEVQDGEVAIKVEFSKKGMDFSSVDYLVYILLKEQYQRQNFIIQEDLNKVNKALDKIEKRDIKTLDEVLYSKRYKVNNINEIIEIINNHKNYMLLYIADEEELGEFIVRNIKDYKIPIEIFHNLEDYIDYKGIAKHYSYENYIDIIYGIDSLILDISNDRDNELVKQLKIRKRDARTIYDTIISNSNRNFNEEQME